MKTDDKHMRRDIFVVRFASVLQILGGAGLCFALVMALLTHQRPYKLIYWLFPLIGPFLFVLGFFVWRLRQWALITGLVMYTLAFISNVFFWFSDSAEGAEGPYLIPRVFLPLFIAYSIARLIYYKAWARR